MCGITGFISSELTKSHLIKMTEAIQHRGPDAEGYFYNADLHVGLGHRRLSILDLSVEANQPMTSHGGRYVMVYNGEVYNYKEIASQLGLSLNTSSDSEVLLEAYAKWGDEFVQQLNGMFAIAIYDLQEKQLKLFRDRLGIKPLYYFFQDNCFAFASEIKSLHQLGIKFQLNQKAVANYFYLGYSPQNSTVFAAIQQLPAGSIGTLENGGFQVSTYWDLADKVEVSTPNNYTESKQHLTETLHSAVAYRMISDVPLGTFLSGGTDSSLVTALASKISPVKINTFSIGFAEAKFNESQHAKAIASHLKTNHHELQVSYTDALDVLDEVMDNFDQPFVDSSALPTYLVSKMAKQNVSVALSGDGGDELFMGYGSYNWGKRLSNPFIWNTRKLIAKGLSLSNSNRNKRAAMVFNCPSKERIKSHIFSQEQYLFNENELPQLLINPSGLVLDEKIKSKRILSFQEEQALFDIQNYLKDDLLIKVDRCSMLTGLEVRVPLLDHRVVESAINLNSSFKISPQGTQKYMLKEVLYGMVPKNLLDHPKQGFSIPLSSWLDNELQYLIEEYLDDTLIADSKVFNLAYVKELKRRFFNGEKYLYNRIWQLIVFNKFLKKNQDYIVQ